MFETLFLQLVQLYGEIFGNCSIRLSNDWNHFYETTDHLQQFRADNFSTFFKSEAFTFSSASSIKFIQVWPETLQHIEVFAPFLFIAFARKMIPFFRFNYLAFMHARLKYFSLLFDAINCFSDRGSSTEIKVKHILAIEETLDLGFELEIESVEVLIPRSPRVAFASN